MSDDKLMIPDSLAVRAAQNLLTDGAYFRDALRTINDWSKGYGIVLLEGVGGWWQIGDTQGGRLWSSHSTFALAVGVLLQVCTERIVKGSRPSELPAAPAEEPTTRPTTYIHGAA